MSRTSANIQSIEKLDPVWDRIRDEAQELARQEPALGGFIFSSVLNHDRFEDALVHRLAQRLGNADLGSDLVMQAFADAIERNPKSALPHGPTSSPHLNAIRPATAISIRCSTSRDTRRSRRTAWRTGCGSLAARILPITCRAGHR